MTDPEGEGWRGPGYGLSPLGVVGGVHYESWEGIDAATLVLRVATESEPSWEAMRALRQLRMLLPPTLSASWLALPYLESAGAGLGLYDLRSGRERANLTLPVVQPSER